MRLPFIALILIATGCSSESPAADGTGIVAAITNEAAAAEMLVAAVPTLADLEGSTGGGGGGGGSRGLLGDGVHYRHSYTYGATFTAAGLDAQAISDAFEQQVRPRIEELGVDVSGTGGVRSNLYCVSRLAYETDAYAGQVMTTVFPTRGEDRFAVLVNVYESTTRRR